MTRCQPCLPRCPRAASAQPCVARSKAPWPRRLSHPCFPRRSCPRLLRLRGPKFTVQCHRDHNTDHDGENPHSRPSDFRGLLVAPIQEPDNPRPQLLSTHLVEYYPGRARPKTVRERARPKNCTRTCPGALGKPALANWMPDERHVSGTNQ
jgi:hypothetical protein